MALQRQWNNGDFPRWARKLVDGVDGIMNDVAQDMVDIIHEEFHAAKSGELDPDGHRRSAPGEAPYSDGGPLDLSVQIIPTANGLEIIVDSPYAEALEYGRVDGTIKPRPFWRPAIERVWPLYQARLRELGNSNAIRGSHTGFWAPGPGLFTKSNAGKRFDSWEDYE